MTADVLDPPREPGSAITAVATVPTDTARVRRVVTESYGFLWRSLRRFGVPEADADDGAQRVLGVFVRRLPDIALGSERAFLFQTAVRVAADMRRATKRSRRTLAEIGNEPLEGVPGPEVVLEQSEARALLEEALDLLDLDLCSVFVLFELEELTTAQIAEVLELPPGTVSSRLKRGREEFKKIVARLRATQEAIRRPR